MDTNFMSFQSNIGWGIENKSLKKNIFKFIN